MADIVVDFDDDLPLLQFAACHIVGGRLAIRGTASVGAQFHLMRDDKTAMATVVESKFRLHFLDLEPWESVVTVMIAQRHDSVVDAFRSAASQVRSVKDAEEFLSGPAIACACMGCVERCRICRCQHSYIAARAKIEGLTVEETMRKTFAGELGWADRG